MSTQSISPGHQRFLRQQQERVALLHQHLCEIYPDPDELVLEIGCGHGHFLAAYAEAHPGVNCLGMDLVSKRIRKANAKRDKRNLKQLHFVKAEVNECMMAWPEHLILQRIFVLFPDPWPKKRHVKNRILQASLLDKLAEISRPGTALHFRTDHAANFSWVKDVVDSHPSWSIQDETRWPFENPSFFQDLFTEYYSLTALFEQ